MGLTDHNGSLAQQEKGRTSFRQDRPVKGMADGI